MDRLYYLTLTRPNLTYGVYLLSQFLQQPRQLDMELAKRIISYISSTTTNGIFYLKDNQLILSAYCDADWSTYPTTR